MANPRRSSRLASIWVNARHGLQFKISLLVVLLVLAVVGSGTAITFRAMGATLFESQLDLARQWATSLAAGAAADMSARDTRISSHHLEETTRALIRRKAAAYVAFVDPDGRIVASAEAKPGLVPHFRPPNGERWQLPKAVQPRLIRRSDVGMTIIQAVAPVYAMQQEHRSGTASGIVGYVLLGTDASVTQAKVVHVGNQLLIMDLIAVLLVIPSTLLATRHIVRPLNQLARAARALANGVMDARAHVTSRNEIGQLARSFNLMANRITQSQMELLQLAAELEQRVEERTRELEDLASKDPLTGLHNRRYFSEEMDREFAAAERYGSHLTCLMFDLDEFKQVNDRFGHRAGDDVLIALAEAITTELRSSDIAARFGGDEFILLLPQTSAEAARSLADRIVHTFTRLVAQQAPGVPTGLSVGIASLSATHAPSAEALVNEADKALYAAKAQGRSCMVEAPCATIA